MMAVHGAAALRGAALAMLLALAACAQGARPEAMVARPSAEPAPAPLRAGLSVGSVAGGRTTDPLWTSQVSNAEFAAALTNSLAVNDMLDTGGRRLRVDATILSVAQPLVGASMEVTTSVHYRVVDVATGTAAFERPISASYTAAFGDHLIGVERLRLATEGAVKRNIEEFVAALREAYRTRR